MKEMAQRDFFPVARDNSSDKNVRDSAFIYYSVRLRRKTAPVQRGNRAEARWLPIFISATVMP